MRLPNFEVLTPQDRGRSTGPVVVVLGAAAGPADAEPACASLRARLEGRPGRLVVCDVAALRDGDIGTVDLICRLATTARDCGCRLVLRAVPWPLRSLVLFAGLADVLPCLEDLPPGSVLQPER